MSVPQIVRNAFSTMSAEEKNAFNDYYSRKSKDSGIAYLCWIFLGLHYAYVGKWGVQLFYWLTLGGFFIWAFVDLFRIPGIIQEYNDQVMIDAIKEIRTISMLYDTGPKNSPEWSNKDLV